MHPRVLIAVAVLSLTVAHGQAEAPDHSPQPAARPAAAKSAALPPVAVPPPATTAPSVQGQPRPRPRPDVIPAQPAQPAQLLSSHPAPVTSPLPPPRPKITAAAEAPANKTAAAPATGPKPGTRGALCGDAALTGTVLAPIKGRVKGCSVAEPVSVEFVAGVRLNPAATLDCPTAEALKAWTLKGLQPAFSPRKVVELRIFGSYTCRSRNNTKGAKLSEHGKGKAIDVGAFVLDNGQTLTVLDNYNKTIRKAQGAACGPFSTTLGPGSDGFHENHLHFDSASYGYGPYCH